MDPLPPITPEALVAALRQRFAATSAIETPRRTDQGSGTSLSVNGTSRTVLSGPV
jgi:hypothetical protein